MSESLKKKGIRSQGPFPCFNNKMEHPNVKYSLLFFIRQYFPQDLLSTNFEKSLLI